MDRISKLKAGTSLTVKNDDWIFGFTSSRFKSLDIFYILVSEVESSLILMLLVTRALSYKAIEFFLNMQSRSNHQPRNTIFDKSLVIATWCQLKIKETNWIPCNIIIQLWAIQLASISESLIMIFFLYNKASIYSRQAKRLYHQHGSYKVYLDICRLISLASMLCVELASGEIKWNAQLYWVSQRKDTNISNFFIFGFEDRYSSLLVRMCDDFIVVVSKVNDIRV